MEGLLCVSSDIAIGTAVPFTVSLSDEETVIDICNYTLKPSKSDIPQATTSVSVTCVLKMHPTSKQTSICRQTINLSYNCELENFPMVYNYCTKVSSVSMYPFHSKTHRQDFMINKLYALFMLKFCSHCLSVDYNYWQIPQSMPVP